MTRTVMIMAGGTGGHIFPALAVAEHLRGCGWNVVWLGSRAGMEARIVVPRGYTMAWVRFAGVRGKGLLRLATLPLELLIAFCQSARAIFLHRPDALLGMGGYVSFPGGMMASLFNRPLAIHEQNSIPGLANRVLARLADRVLTGFPGAFGPRTAAVWTGNPVRAEFPQLPDPTQRFARRAGALRLLIVGGSQGADVLNRVVPEAVALLPETARPLVTHQCGAGRATDVEERYRRSAVQAQVVEFIDDIVRCYAEADVVVCRAGASTIAELAAAGVAAVLVPYPHAVDDHQTSNARFLADREAAILLPQGECTPAGLAATLATLTRERLLAMAHAARGAGRPDATRAVAQACMELAG